MAQRKQLNQQIDQMLTDETANIGPVQETIMEEYKQLSDKCDLVIKKIRDRKVKKSAAGAEGK